MSAEKITPRSRWLKALCLGLGYLAAAEASWLLSPHGGTYVSFWFPGGVFVAGLMMAGASDWVALVLAVNVANIGFNLCNGVPLLLSVALSGANTIQAVGGAYLFRRFVARTTRLTALKEFLGLVAFAVVLSSVVGATIGAAALVATGTSDSYLDSWTTWWVGNAMSTLIVAPFVLIWFSPAEAGQRWWKEPRRLIEAALIVFGLLAASWQMLVRGHGVMTPYNSVLIPFILWAALRFGVRGASAINLLLALQLTFLASLYLKGLSSEQIFSGSYISVTQMFLAVCALVALIPAIAIAERDGLVWQLGRDITERKAMEVERREIERKAQESQRLESLGILARGIAHDFNNILSGIFGFTKLARDAAGANPELRGYLDEIGRAGHRAAELVRQILAFTRARGGEEARWPVNLGNVVDEAVKLLRATSPSTITFETHLAQDLPAVEGDATQLHQIVMNLGTNAVHAMHELPGRLMVRLESCEVDEPLARTLSGIDPGPFVRLIVSDTGSGMDAATQGRVFEPFFTTKATSEGTGLGLSVVHGIVHSHRGAIRLTSEVGRGTTFDIYLPAVVGVPASDRDEPLTIPRGRGQRILFVDDEIPIVTVGKLSLTRFGYDVVAESRVMEALARLEREPQAFQLVVTDQTMPELTGLDFAARVRALRGDLPVVLATGYSVDLTPERIRAAGVCEVLDKPYTIDGLAAAVGRNLMSNRP